MAKKSSVEQIVESIGNLTALELADLVKAVEDKFGVTAAVPVAAAPAAAVAEQPDQSAEEEKTQFDVVLSSVGDKKIQVIKVVRAVTGLGLKEAKELVDNAPGTVKQEVSKEESETIKTQLEEVGATVEIK